MPHVFLRESFGVTGPNDLKVSVQENTYAYLMSSRGERTRVSAYFDADSPTVAATYAELFVSEDCPFESRVEKITPGSRTRKGIQLPDAMTIGEQLTVEVVRTVKAGVELPALITPRS